MKDAINSIAGEPPLPPPLSLSLFLYFYPFFYLFILPLTENVKDFHRGDDDGSFVFTFSPPGSSAAGIQITGFVPGLPPFADFLYR